MFLITDFTASPARTYELNDINDACDVILGITNDMEIAEEAGSVMGRMTFGHEYTRLSYFSVRCVMDGNNADSVTGRKAKEPEKKYMLMEVIERDADATTPFCRHTCFTLCSRDPRIQGLLDDYAARGIRVQFQDITSEFGVPVYRCFVTARDGSVATATGAGLRGSDAALSALTETPWPYSWATPAPHGVASGPGLAGLARRALEDLPDWSLPTAEASLRLLENVLAAHGREVLHVDLTRADLDIPVARVLVPGLEPHADFDALTRPAPRLFARQALLNEGASAGHPLFRV